MEVVKADEKFKCFECGKVFKDNAHLRIHKNRKTPCLIREVALENLHNPNRCLYCNIVFVQKQSLTRHLKTCRVKNGKVIIPDQKLRDKEEMRILREQNEALLNRMEKLEAVVAETKMELNKKEKKEKPDANSFIYFIGAFPWNSKIKIGYSKDPDMRIKQLATGNPEKLMIYHTMKYPEYAKLEKTMHHILADKRITGEWFDISQSEFVGLINPL